MKDYFLKWVCAAAPEDGRLQDALEEGLKSGKLRLTGEFAADLQAAADYLMEHAGKPGHLAA